MIYWMFWEWEVCVGGSLLRTYSKVICLPPKALSLAAEWPQMSRTVPYQPCSHYSLVMLCFIMNPSSISHNESYSVGQLLSENFLRFDQSPLLTFRCQLHRKPSLHDCSRQCCRSGAGTVPEKHRQLPLIPEPHKLPLASHQKWPCKWCHLPYNIPYIISRFPVSLLLTSFFRPQDCLRSCQEQIESLLESSLRQAQQHISTETKRVEEDVDLSCTPTDVRDINIWRDRYSSRVRWISSVSDGYGLWPKASWDKRANGLLPAPHHLTNTSKTCPLSTPKLLTAERHPLWLWRPGYHWPGPPAEDREWMEILIFSFGPLLCPKSKVKWCRLSRILQIV